jgi:ParB/RepB/Spo0J family partition protein
MVTDVEISRLLPHPENSNRMDAETLSKLRHHIESTGRYEPLVVRPHPTQEGKFQVINGHHRLQVLKALGRVKARCVTWEVDDDQTRLYLATLNRLSGEDIPERRALLVGSLLESFEVDDLAGLLPESPDQITELQRLAQVDLDQLAQRPSAQLTGEPQVILEFFLDGDSARQVNLALDVIVCRYPEMDGRAEALVHLARGYLSAGELSSTPRPPTESEAGADS